MYELIYIYVDLFCIYVIRGLGPGYTIVGEGILLQDGVV